MKEPVVWWVYVLRCGDGSLYTGATSDLPRRLAAHRAGRGARYTRGRGPIELAYSRPCADRSDALRREHEIKRMTAAAKRALFASDVSEAT